MSFDTVKENSKVWAQNLLKLKGNQKNKNKIALFRKIQFW